MTKREVCINFPTMATYTISDICGVSVHMIDGDYVFYTLHVRNKQTYHKAKIRLNERFDYFPYIKVGEYKVFLHDLDMVR